MVLLHDRPQLKSRSVTLSIVQPLVSDQADPASTFAYAHKFGPPVTSSRRFGRATVSIVCRRALLEAGDQDYEVRYVEMTCVRETIHRCELERCLSQTALQISTLLITKDQVLR